MRLVLPAPILDRLDPVEIAPGVRIRIHRAEPLPFDLDTWATRVAGPAIVSTERGHTEAGWPVCLIRTANPTGLFGFFELCDRGVVVVATADEPAALDGAVAEIRRLLLAADIDREPRDVVALAQIWDAV